jgi:hypothetical protein
VDTLDDLRRQEALGGLDVRRVLGDLGELAVVLRGAQLEVDPGLDVGGRFPQQVCGRLREQQPYVPGGGVGRQLADPGDRRERAPSAAPPRDRQTQPSGGRSGLGQ